MFVHFCDPYTSQHDSEDFFPYPFFVLGYCVYLSDMREDMKNFLKASCKTKRLFLIFEKSLLLCCSYFCRSTSEMSLLYDAKKQVKPYQFNLKISKSISLRRNLKLCFDSVTQHIVVNFIHMSHVSVTKLG